MLKFSKTITLADGLIEGSSSMLDEIASETVNKEEECDGRKRSKILKEVYPVENIRKNPLSFVVISLILQEVPLHTN